MIRYAIALFLLLAPTVVLAEAIDYEIYEISKTGNKLVAKGKRQYSVNEVEVHPYQREGRQIAEKLIELEQGYRVGVRIFFEKELTGFGLLAQRSDQDFSWEWYKKVSGNRFKKLQGGTTVEVKVTGQPLMEELIEVKFVEDSYLRFRSAGARDDTHQILVKAGSVLRFR